jgi:hypothetical protein
VQDPLKAPGPEAIGKQRVECATGRPYYWPTQAFVAYASRQNWLDRLRLAQAAMAFLVAKTVVQIAKDGEHDPQRLSERVIRVAAKAPL